MPFGWRRYAGSNSAVDEWTSELPAEKVIATVQAEAGGVSVDHGAGEFHLKAGSDVLYRIFGFLSLPSFLPIEVDGTVKPVDEEHSQIRVVASSNEGYGLGEVRSINYWMYRRAFSALFRKLRMATSSVADQS